MEKLNELMKLFFTKVRKVPSPTRANQGDAGIDFYIPNITPEDLFDIQVNFEQAQKKSIWVLRDTLIIEPGGRVLIPSGIKVLLEPEDSALIAANKSGIATKTGLLYTAEVIDSSYLGEVHIGIFNSGNRPVSLRLFNIIKPTKIMQFLHIPVFYSQPIMIDNKEYGLKSIQKNSTRGERGFGSTDNE